MVEKIYMKKTNQKMDINFDKLEDKDVKANFK
jgi:hypothetical protein